MKPVERVEEPRVAGRAEHAGPAPILGFGDAIALIVGIVVGAGIFRTPSLVAAAVPNAGWVLLLWFIGGAVSIIGALCYAELASAYPDPGGDYHFLRRAFGRPVAFFFAWARLTVIPTGSLALLGFIFGDYASEVLRLGEHSSAVYAGLMIASLTALNARHLHHGRRTQNLLTAVVIAGVALVVVAGLVALPEAAGPRAVGGSGTGGHAGWGLALVFVLLTYGGWNEAAYVSAELRGGRRRMAGVLAVSLGAVTVLYLLMNLAFLNGLGIAGVASSDAVAADLMRRPLGAAGAQLISLLVAGAVLTSANATVLMGSRTAYALGRDFALFEPLGRWSARARTPVNAILVQGSIALALVVFGALSRRGFETMVEYTAPVFWLFFLLTGVSLFVLRRREPRVERPFRVPLYPLTPALFCVSSGYLLYSSLAYTGIGAIVGVAVLATGIVPFWLDLRRERQRAR